MRTGKTKEFENVELIASSIFRILKCSDSAVRFLYAFKLSNFQSLPFASLCAFKFSDFQILPFASLCAFKFSNFQMLPVAPSAFSDFHIFTFCHSPLLYYHIVSCPKFYRPPPLRLQICSDVLILPVAPAAFPNGRMQPLAASVLATCPTFKLCRSSPLRFRKFALSQYALRPLAVVEFSNVQVLPLAPSAL